VGWTGERKGVGDTVSNLDLWERHFKPHKDALKSAPRGMTAIDPMWTIREATEEWGPIGDKWGFKVVKEEIVTSQVAGTSVHTVLIELWYPCPDDDELCGRVQSFGGTTMDGTNSKGPYLDDDYAKKSITDALSKALSWLGFGAAVHMGMFDGNKYADLRPGAKEDKPEATVEPTASTSADIDAAWEVVKGNIQKLTDKIGEDEYRIWHSRMLTNYYKVDTIKEMNAEQLVAFAEQQQERLKQGKE